MVGVNFGFCYPRFDRGKIALLALPSPAGDSRGGETGYSDTEVPETVWKTGTDTRILRRY
jgi:hypothetical protein